MPEVAPANKTVYVVAIARHRGQAVTPTDARGLHDERSSGECSHALGSYKGTPRKLNGMASDCDSCAPSSSV